MLSIMLNLRFRGQVKAYFHRRIWQVCPCAVIMAAMRFYAMCLRIMLLSRVLPLLLLQQRVRLPLRQADWELRLLRRWMVMLCRRGWCGGSLLMRSCILIRRCIGVRDINYRLRRRGFWTFSASIYDYVTLPCLCQDYVSDTFVMLLFHGRKSNQKFLWPRAGFRCFSPCVCREPKLRWCAIKESNVG